MSSKKLPNIITLQNIVRNFLNDLEIYNDHNYKRYMQWAIRGYMKLNLHYLNIPEVAKITVNNNNIAELPEDFIDYERIARVVNGELRTYSRNDNLNLNRSQTCFEEDVDTDLQSGDGTSYMNWEQAPMKIYNLAHYSVDYRNNRIVFKGDMMGNEIIVEYISSGVSIEGETWIPRIAQEALIAWLHYQRSKFSGLSETAILRFSREWGHELDLLVESQTSFTPQELLDVLDSGRSTLIK